MKAKLNEFLDKMQTPAIILMLCFLLLFLIFAVMLQRNQKRKAYRKTHLIHKAHIHPSRNQKHSK